MSYRGKKKKIIIIIIVIITDAAQFNILTEYSFRADNKKTSKASRLLFTRIEAYNNRKHLKIWESALFNG